jgi:hypothetical protein
MAKGTFILIYSDGSISVTPTPEIVEDGEPTLAHYVGGRDALYRAEQVLFVCAGWFSGETWLMKDRRNPGGVPRCLISNGSPVLDSRSIFDRLTSSPPVPAPLPPFQWWIVRDGTTEHRVLARTAEDARVEAGVTCERFAANVYKLGDAPPTPEPTPVSIGQIRQWSAVLGHKQFRVVSWVPNTSERTWQLSGLLSGCNYYRTERYILRNSEVVPQQKAVAKPELRATLSPGYGDSVIICPVDDTLWPVDKLRALKDSLYWLFRNRMTLPDTLVSIQWHVDQWIQRQIDQGRLTHDGARWKAV